MTCLEYPSDVCWRWQVSLAEKYIGGGSTAIAILARAMFIYCVLVAISQSRIEIVLTSEMKSGRSSAQILLEEQLG